MGGIHAQPKTARIADLRRKLRARLMLARVATTEVVTPAYFHANRSLRTLVRIPAGPTPQLEFFQCHAAEDHLSA